MTMADRIKVERKALGFSQGELAERAGVKQQMISKLETGQAQSTGDLAAIARALNVAPWWLQTGDGPKHPAAATISDPTAAARVSIEPPHGSRVGVWDILDDLPSDKYLTVPLYEVELSAGQGAVWCEHAEDELLVFRTRYFRAKGIKPQNCRALYVRGDSMTPELKDGDTVMIDVSRTAVRDDVIFAVMYHGELYIKRLFRLPGSGVELRSDNDRYKSYMVEGEDMMNLAILGEMVWRAG
jgi:phage repressor protein C with HTH and peptisase S24 domain